MIASRILACIWFALTPRLFNVLSVERLVDVVVGMWSAKAPRISFPSFQSLGINLPSLTSSWRPFRQGFEDVSCFQIHDP